MNGDSYSSRGMASTTALPRIRKHETDSSHSHTADAGRYGSSRDYYVSATSYCVAISLIYPGLFRARETTAETEIPEIETSVERIDGALDLHIIEEIGRRAVSRK